MLQGPVQVPVWVAEFVKECLICTIFIFSAVECANVEGKPCREPNKVMHLCTVFILQAPFSRVGKVGLQFAASMGECLIRSYYTVVTS